MAGGDGCPTDNDVETSLVYHRLRTAVQDGSVISSMCINGP